MSTEPAKTTEPEAPKPGEQAPEPKMLTHEQLVEANRSKNAENKSLRDRLREAEATRDQYKTALDATKPADQIEAERITALQAERDELFNQNAALVKAGIIAAVQKATGLPDNLVDRLRGETAEELTADAKALVQMITPGPTAPTPNPGQHVKKPVLDPSQAFAAELFGDLL